MEDRSAEGGKTEDLWRFWPYIQRLFAFACILCLPGCVEIAVVVTSRVLTAVLTLSVVTVVAGEC